MAMYKKDESDLQRKRQSNAICIAFGIIASFALLWYVKPGGYSHWSMHPPPAKRSVATDIEEFSWSNIEPKRYLEYTPCFDKYQCARLDIPMDWNATNSTASRIAVAVVRFPAPVPVTDTRYGGPILLNPGGPGASGVDFTLAVGEAYSTMLSSEDKYFDIMSFDPRGTGHTTPHLKCFPDTFSSDIWNYQSQADGVGRSSVEWAKVKALSTGCSQHNELLEHMNTAPVVADMIEILEMHGEWRSKEADALLASNESQIIAAEKGNNNTYSRDAIVERTQWRQGEEKLQYWGFSYGTILGATFAALQPHRVKRIILDGVVDSTDYYLVNWLKNLQDTDKVMDKFFEYCHTAGPEKCALNTGTSSAADIETWVTSLLSSLKKNPLAVPASETRGPEIIMYSDVIIKIVVAMYAPLVGFQDIVNLLVDIDRNNGSMFADLKQQGREPFCPLNKCELPYSEPCQPTPGVEARYGIMCSDGIDVTQRTYEDFIENMITLEEQSKWLGEVWSSIAMPCSHWKARAKWIIPADEIKGDTAHPILFVGNTRDPVTPFINAETMSQQFPGSVVLKQDSEGHASISSPSLCTVKILRNFLTMGQLPDEGTVCQPEWLPFIGNATYSVEAVLTADDERLLAALQHISENTPKTFFQ